MSDRIEEAEEAVARARSALETAEAGLQTAEQVTRKAEEKKTLLLWALAGLTAGIALLVFLQRRS